MSIDTSSESIASIRPDLPGDVAVLAPTALEYWATRLILPHKPVRKAGIGLSHWDPVNSEAVVVCGLAGSLIRGLEPGTVLIPDLVRTPDGSIVRCDTRIRQSLIRGARVLGFNPEGGPLLTASSMVMGSERARWAARGFVAADMETGLLSRRVSRFATVRVILDSPARSISGDWLSPDRALMRPTLWPELLWMMGAAPLFSLRAARVLKAGLECLQDL
ncbi:MAG: hypothetical protein M3Z66_04720 [Chloroflexota bacterium]|nr:hypothetical protein [Chloroflexota bacterium]